MSTSPDLFDRLRHLLPDPVIGAVSAIVPVHMGLSGAGVYAVSGARGAFILRVQSPLTDEREWTDQLLVWRRAAAHGIAPPIEHVDPAARAVVSRRLGQPLPVALADPTQRPLAIASLVTQLRALHALPPDGVPARDGILYTRTVWRAQRARPGFPPWAADLEPLLDDIAAALAADRRRVVSHNDVNPGNVLWDGQRAWLVDWDAAGLAHPFYDLAALATFLGLDADAAHGLLAMQEQTTLDDSARATFAALRRLVALAAGCTFLGLVPDLVGLVPPSRADASTLAACYARMRAGSLQVQAAAGQAAFGLALLRLGTEPE